MKNKLKIIPIIIFGLLILSFDLAHGAGEEYVAFSYPPTDSAPSCNENNGFAQYADLSLYEICYCKKEVEGESTVYKWCQLDGGGCGSSTSCD